MYKKILINSRVHVTEELIKRLKRCPTPPQVCISGSAIGYYGPQGDIELNESGFLGVAEMLGRLDLSGGKIVEFPAVLEVRLFGISKMKTAKTIVGHALTDAGDFREIVGFGDLRRQRLGRLGTAADHAEQHRAVDAFAMVVRGQIGQHQVFQGFQPGAEGRAD